MSFYSVRSWRAVAVAFFSVVVRLCGRVEAEMTRWRWKEGRGGRIDEGHSEKTSNYYARLGEAKFPFLAVVVPKRMIVILTAG